MRDINDADSANFHPSFLLTEAETCRFLRQSPSWLRRRRAARQPPAFIKASKSVRYELSALTDFLKANTIEPDRGEGADER